MPPMLPAVLGRREDPLKAGVTLMEMFLHFLEEKIAGPQGAGAPMSINSTDNLDSAAQGAGIGVFL
jgi:hypothetical protein